MWSGQVLMWAGLVFIHLSITTSPAHAWYWANHYQADRRQHYTPVSSCESSSFRTLPCGLRHEHQCLAMEQLSERVRAGLEQRRTDSATVSHRLQAIEHRLTQALRRAHTRHQMKEQPGLRDIPTARDCHELQVAGVSVSGVYPVTLQSGVLVNVLCDMDTDGGGWTVVQQRAGGSVNFTRGWDDYAFGFGNVNTEYWLGNEYIHSLTSHTRYSLRVDMWDWDDGHAHAQYDTFHVGPETTGYRLTVEKFRSSSTAGDSLKHHSGMKFSTTDRDNDNWVSSCAQVDRSGWWFNRCSFCSLNGQYTRGGARTTSDEQRRGITWFSWKQRAGHSLMKVQMKVKTYAAVLHHEALLNATGSGEGEDPPLFH